MTLDWSALDSFLKAEILPQAQRMDQDSTALFRAFQSLGRRNLLALKVSEALGGRDLTALDYARFQIQISSISGSLAFLQTQHQSALSLISRSQNLILSQAILQKALTGTAGIGVGFSHLRRPGDPMLKATPVSNGYELTGQIPWVTGYGCFEKFIGGATLPTGEIVMGVIPLTGTPSDLHLKISEPLPLSTMNSTQTVTVTLDRWILSSTQVVAIYPAQWLQRQDQAHPLRHSFFAIGTATAALRVIQEQTHRHPLDLKGHQAIASLQQEYQVCHQSLFDLIPLETKKPDQCLQAKARAISLAGRCAQAAVAVCGGSANRSDHDAQRIYREVLAFTVFGQTPDSKLETLWIIANLHAQ